MATRQGSYLGKSDTKRGSNRATKRLLSTQGASFMPGRPRAGLVFDKIQRNSPGTFFEKCPEDAKKYEML